MKKFSTLTKLAAICISVGSFTYLGIKFNSLTAPPVVALNGPLIFDSKGEFKSDFKTNYSNKYEIDLSVVETHDAYPDATFQWTIMEGTKVLKSGVTEPNSIQSDLSVAQKAAIGTFIAAADTDYTLIVSGKGLEGLTQIKPVLSIQMDHLAYKDKMILPSILEMASLSITVLGIILLLIAFLLKLLKKS